jgi:hypothetical protein
MPPGSARNDRSHPAWHGQLLNSDPAIGPTNDGTDGNGDNVQQAMLGGAIHTRVSKSGKCVV